MKLSYFAKIVLRAVDSADTDQTLYVSTNGGHRDDSGMKFFRPDMTVQSSLSNAFGRGSDTYQVPGSISVSIQNPDGFYDDFLPNGTTAQYWELSSFTLYDGDTSSDGDTLASMNAAFIGKIAQGSFQYSRGLEVINLQVFDVVSEHNQQIVTEAFQDHSLYVAGTDTVAGTTAIPVVMGDFTTDSAKLPVFLLDDSGVGHVFAVCNHEIGSVLVTNETTPATITPDATSFATGSFTVNTTNPNYTAGDVLSVQCVGYPTDLTDENHVRLAQFVLTEFGSATLADIHNDVDSASNNERGSFKVLYDDTGGATADYPSRIYLTDTATLSVNLANIILFEANGKMAVSDNVYKVFWELPLAASGATTILENFELPGSVNVLSDPNEEFATVYKVQYNNNPFDEVYLGLENTDKTITSGAIFDRRTQYKTGGLPDTIREFSNKAVYTSVAVTSSLQRRLLWAILIPQIAKIDFGAFAQDAKPYDFELYNDFVLDSVTYRVYGINKNVLTGSINIDGLVLSGLLQSGVWADASGNDADGNPVTTSIWADAAGTDGAGNNVTSTWI